MAAQVALRRQQQQEEELGYTHFNTESSGEPNEREDSESPEVVIYNEASGESSFLKSYYLNKVMT